MWGECENAALQFGLFCLSCSRNMQNKIKELLSFAQPVPSCICNLLLASHFLEYLCIVRLPLRRVKENYSTCLYNNTESLSIWNKMPFPRLWLQHTQTGDKGATAKLIRALSKASIRKVKSLRRSNAWGPAGGRRDRTWTPEMVGTPDKHSRDLPYKQERAMQIPSQILDLVRSAVTLS